MVRSRCTCCPIHHLPGTEVAACLQPLAHIDLFFSGNSRPGNQHEAAADESMSGIAKKLAAQTKWQTGRWEVKGGWPLEKIVPSQVRF